jgi:hypothetical protein
MARHLVAVLLRSGEWHVRFGGLLLKTKHERFFGLGLKTISGWFNQFGP